MRWTILRTLLHKEALRHLANKGGLVLYALLLVAAMLLSFFGNRPGPGGGLTPGVALCYVDYHADSPFVQYLRTHVPPDLEDRVRFRPLGRADLNERQQIVYPPNTAAIQLRPASEGEPGDCKAWFWHPGTDAAGLAPFEVWFWKASCHFAQQNCVFTGPAAAGPHEEETSALAGGYDARSGIAASLVLFALFFTCVYLLPALTCEERERGVLLAQALSPATTTELLAARFLFYPALGLTLAAVLAGTYRPAVLLSPFFWAALVAAVTGSMGIGLTIASLARTQREASMGALSYALVVALLVFICQQNNIPGLPSLALEYHCPRMIHAALTGAVNGWHYLHLLGAAVLAVFWVTLAGVLFRRQGWQ